MNLHLSSAALILAIISAPLHAHSRLSMPAARTSTDAMTQAILDGGGLDFDAPCGENSDIPPGQPTARWRAGSDQTVTVDHQIFHGDERYQFYVSADGGVNFEEVSAPQTTDDTSIPYQTGGVQASDTGAVALRIGLPPTAGVVVLRYTDGEYFSCADIELTATTPLLSDAFESGDTQAWTPTP